MSLYSDLNDVLTPYAQRIKGLAAANAKIKADLADESEKIDALNGAFDANCNLFNPSKKITGLLRANNGVVDTTYTAYMASDYIPVTAGDSIRMQYDVNGVRKDSGIDNTVAFYSTAFYDSNKVFVSNSGGNGVRVANAPEGSYYFRFSLKNDKYESVTNIAVIVSQDSTIIPFMPYGSIGDLKVDKIPESYDEHINDIVEGAIDNHDFKIAPKQTTFFHLSKNLINPETRITGEFVNQSSGVFETNSGHTRTDYLLIDENTTYVLRTEGGSAGFRYFFYDVNKNPIANSGALMPSTNNMLVTSPNGATYIVVSLNTGVSPWMLAKYADGNTGFESYDSAYIAPKYIPYGEIEFLSFPDKIYATAGYELNIYFDNLTENCEDYVWEVSCEKGKQFERGYTITPTDSDAGSYTMTLRVLAKENYTPLIEKIATLIITASTAGAETSKSLIVLGDSTTNNGTVIVKLHENFNEDSMSITTLGTRGIAPNNMEGRAGWALQDYFTRASAGDVQNPFYNPSTQTFDAGYYFSETGIAKPDWFFVNMGINDMFNMKTDQTAKATAESCISYIEQIIASVKTASPSTKLGICITIPPNHSQDAFGKAYPNRQWRNRYKRNNLILVKKIIETFTDRESEDVFLIPIHTNLDTVYNMGLETLQVNSRNTITYESPILNGGVHPAESGYWQIADVYTAFLKANI